MYEAAVIGVSAGGMKALRTLFQALSNSFQLPLIIVQHEASYADDFLAKYLSGLSSLSVKQAHDKEDIEKGSAYLAPPGYHLMIEDDQSFALSTDAPVNYARPSIDVLFETAADVYGTTLIGIILTGANDDGSRGLKYLKDIGGLAIVQNPATAEVSSMPEKAIERTQVDHILTIEEIATFLNKLIPFDDG